jgi:N-acetylneuraminic acid mutarotase
MIDFFRRRFIMGKKTIIRVLAGFISIYFLVALPSISFAKTGEWTTESPMPTARYGLSTSVVNGQIYAIGGRAGDKAYSIVEVYDPASDTWTRKADMPEPRYRHGVGVVNGKIYIMGGIEGSIGPTKLVEEYDPAIDTWRRRADLPTNRSAFSASVVNGKIYAISGHQSGSLVARVDEYDPATDTWRRRADIPTARSSLSTSVVDGKIYAIGGATWNNVTSEGTFYTTVEEYDPVTDIWMTKSDMSTARYALSTSAVNGKIYAIGGTATNTIFSIVEEYDPAKDTWTIIMDMPTGRFHFGTIVVDGRIYAIGGQPGPYPEVTSAVEVYQAIPWGFAQYPNPKDGALYSSTWVNLSWVSGDFAVSHDVYLGDSFEDVNDGLGGTFCGNQAISFRSVGLPGSPYPEGLVRGQTYYWRVDEVNDTEPDSPWKGPIWSFTIQPQTAYNPSPADGAEFVDLNVELNWSAGVDAALHAVYFGDNFDDVNNAAADLNQRGSTNTQANTTYSPGPLEFAKTYYWRVDELTGGRNSRILKGDIWSFTTRGAAESPKPFNHAESVRMNAILSWIPADNATLHQVYFGIDKEAVRKADISSPEYKGTQMLGNEDYDPGILSCDTTYYWRIDEVSSDNPDTPLPGNVWSFTTGDFFVIDDFEHYDANDYQIWYAWHDGVGYGVPDTDPYFSGNGTGAVVGDETTSSYTEETIVHSGNQSMPVVYDNNKQGYSNYSEVEHILAGQRDWTDQGVTELSLWFRGYPGSVGSFIEGPAGTFTMTASGADIWNVNGVEADEFYFAYKMFKGAGSIIAKVNSIDNTNAWAKAGVMIRETLDPDSAHAMMCVTPGSGISFQRRPSTGATSLHTTTAGITAPYRIKIERSISGNFTASSSTNGTTWTMQGTPQNIPMGANVYIGLALTAHDAALTCQASFSNITTTGNVTGQWTHQDIGILSNDAEPLYVAVSNSAGNHAMIVHDDPAAAYIDTWIEWVIPLSTFADQGIDLTNVGRIAIGLGTQGNMTVPGGSGKMYFDDIRLYQQRSTP